MRYLLPFAFLALVPIGGVLGGAWTFLAATATPLALILLDRVVGDERKPGGLRTGGALRWLPRIYILFQLAATIWMAKRIAGGARPVEILGLAASTGVTSGVFGFLAAHELVHSRDRREQALGLIFLASLFYMHFRIAHLFGHHRRAATIHDPATARLGESLYAFLVRSVAGQWREAWAHERERLRRSGRHIVSIRNRMLVYCAIEIATIAAIVLVNVVLAVFLICVAAIAIALLETFNYVAHYGILRRRQADGRFEALQPKHSWNSRGWMNNAALFNMGCHSEHHLHPCRSFDRLTPMREESELPSGYAEAAVMALAPPFWRRLMDPRVRMALLE